MRGADLTRAILCDFDLHDADLNGANLSDAALIRADLKGASLIGAKMENAELDYANLKGADLSRANLKKADLSFTNLVAADLSGANLTHADLIGADLTNATLTGAILTRATMVLTNLNRTALGNAEMTEANFGETIFANLDLTTVVGLETCNHFMPSIIDYRTIKKCRGLPVPFLRGIGLPVGNAIQYHSCFISYSAKDQLFVDRIYVDLQKSGVRCWFAPHDMPIGGKIREEISSAIRLRDKVLLILSEHSIKSNWVEDEVDNAFEEERKRKEIVLFPIRLDE